MKAVILAGGLGKRLRPFTEVIPKPLMPLGEKAILEIQIERLKEFGFTEIFLATNYKSEYIENFLGNGDRYGVKLSVSKEKIPLGTVGPIWLIKDQLRETFLLMNGDILTLLNFSRFYEFAVTKDTLLTVAIKKEIVPFSFGNIFYNGDYVTDIEEKPDIETNILAGIYVLKPGIMEFLPENKYYNMDVLIKRLLAENNPIAKYEMKEYWLDIGRIDDFDQAQDIYNNNFKTAMNS